MRPGVQLLALAAVAGCCPALAAEQLLVTYIEKPPYYYTDVAGAPRGFLVERVRQIMVATGLEIKLESRPPNRALQELKTEPRATCSIGWFRTTDREAFARFTLPIYHDHPLIAVALTARASELTGMGGLAPMLAQPKLQVGAVAGYSYGEKVDRLLQPLADRLDRAPSPQSNLAKLIAGRVDVALFNTEELDFLISQSPEVAGRVTRIGLPDVPPGKARYLMCSQRVDGALIEQLDRSISRLRFDREK